MVSEKRDKLVNEMENKAKYNNFYNSLIKEVSGKFEVKKYRKEKIALLTLSNVINKVIAENPPQKILDDLKECIGFDLIYFQELKLAYGWASFIGSNGIVEEQPGNAELVKDLLFIIDEKFGFKPTDDSFKEITQEFLDNRNTKGKELVRDKEENDKSYLDLLKKLGA